MNSSIVVMLKKECKCIVSQLSFWVNALLSCGVFIWIGSTAIVNTFKAFGQANSEMEIHVAMTIYQYILIFYPLSLFMFISFYIFNHIFVNEKIAGQMEALLTSPVSCRQIWIAKCISILALVYPFVVATMLVLILLVNYSCGIGTAYSTELLLLCFILVPFLSFSIVSLLGIISLLIKKVNVVQSIVFVFGFGTAFGGAYAIQVLIRNSPIVHSSEIQKCMYIVLIASLIIHGLLWILQKRISRDTIVRSIC